MSENLSEKVILKRKELEQKRLHLNQVETDLDSLEDEYERILADLVCIERSEKRRFDVGLETEKTLVETKEELERIKKEMGLVLKTQ